jgi:protein-S-isoprenylcysteine O-methyltransferase Ste14
MRSVFIKPVRMTFGMKVITIAGTTFALLHFWAILTVRDLPISVVCIASALYGSASALFWWAVTANRARPLRACFSPNEQPHLNQLGPYRFVRHPFYCSYLLTWLAGILATRNPWLVPTVIIMLAIYMNAAIGEEEQFARSSLADEYKEYRSHTGRFLPNPWKVLLRRGSR